MYTLEDQELLKISQKKHDEKSSTFVLEPLSPGYGMTIGNALRRVLLTSLEGAAITSVKIEGVSHEFSTLPGVKEDIVEIILNIKSLRIRLHGDDPASLKLSKKGPGKVTTKDFSKNSQVEIIDPEFVIANLDNKGKLDLEVTVEKGKGYIPTEARKDEKLPLGVIAIDSIFTPIKKVHYEVENTRVGGMTNFDKLSIDITTDGTIEPENALKTASRILYEHFDFITQLGITKSDKKKEAKIQGKQTIKEKKNDLSVNKKIKKTKTDTSIKKLKVTKTEKIK